MRNLKIEELTHVYGAGGSSKSCTPSKGKGGTGGKHGSGGTKSHGSKQGTNKGSKGKGCY
jgi:hypothetical protein